VAKGNVESSNDNVPFNIASAMALSVPMIILFVIFKNKLMGNISLGGIKE
jgi:ABC-type maltose transport system permease subunit